MLILLCLYCFYIPVPCLLTLSLCCCYVFLLCSFVMLCNFVDKVIPSEVRLVSVRRDFPVWIFHPFVVRLFRFKLYLRIRVLSFIFFYCTILAIETRRAIYIKRNSTILELFSTLPATRKSHLAKAYTYSFF